MIAYRHRSIDGRYLSGWPLTVLRDGRDAVVGYIPHGAEISRPAAQDGRELRELPLAERWAHPRIAVRRSFTLVGQDDLPGHLVLVFPRGRAHSIWVFRTPDRVRGWYVNLEDPHDFGERTISTRDHILDLWVPGETGTPHWKDEDELEAAVAAGRFTADEAGTIRAEGLRVIAERPWPTGWEEYEPDPSRPPPELFAGWDVA